MAGGFGTGFLQGLNAGSDFARQYQDAEKRRQQEELAKWSAEQLAQDAAPAESTVAAAPAPAPTPAPAALAPAEPMSYADAFKEATGPTDTRPMDAAMRAAMPAQVDNPAPGRGVGAGMEALLHPERFANDAPRMVKTGMPVSAPASDKGGLLEPGNIDLTKRPVVKNADGSISTVRSMSVGMDGKEYLIPTVADDGSRILSDDEAIKQFQRTGKHLGAFDTPEHATAYADTLHNDQARMYAASAQPSEPAPTQAPAATPTAAPSAPAAEAAPAEAAPAPRKFSIDDYQRRYIEKAASLGLADEANKGMAEVIARKYSSAAMNAYMNGNYDDIYRIYNLLPDGHSVKREVVPQNADGTGGGVKLTMVNDKTGQAYGQPRVFRDEREAAGAMIAASDPKLLTSWLTAQGKEDNTLMRMMLSQQHNQQKLAEIQRNNDLRDRASAADRDNRLITAVMRGQGGSGSGSGSGSRSGKGEATPFKQDDFFKNYATVDGAVAPWGPSAYAYANQIVENNPALAQSEGGRAMAASMAANVARYEAAPIDPKAAPDAPGQANYRRLPILNANGTWDIGARDEDGNTYYLQRNVNPAALIRKDKDGKAIGGIDDGWIKQQEVGFMQNYAKQNPDRFRELAAGASDPESMRKMAVLAQADPSKQADLRIMQMAQKYGANPTAVAQPAGNAPAAPAAPRQIFTDAELQDAKKLGVEPNVPLFTRVGNAWDSVKSAVSGIGEVTPESFGRYVAQARRTGRFDADAQLLMAAMQRNPALAKQLTPQELNAVQVAANKRL